MVPALALQKILVIVLVLLQFAAPLVHAHTGNEITGSGLHVPGLESFSVGSNTNEISSIDRHFGHNSGIVSIGSAIQQKHQACIDESSDAVLSQPSFSFHLALLDYYINFSPQSDQPFPTPFIFQHSTRAPPNFGMGMK